MIKCENCIYSKVVGDKRYCVRYPPAVYLENPSGTGHISIFPEVEDKWRCGEGQNE